MTVKYELLRPKDNSRSEPMNFTYKPSRRYGKCRGFLFCFFSFIDALLHNLSVFQLAFLLGKRLCTTSSRSDSFSSFEAPRKIRPSGQKCLCLN